MKKNTCCPDTAFDWSMYEDGWKGGNHLLKNKKIKTGHSGDVVYSREKYAQDLYRTLTVNNPFPCVSKDLIKGELVSITGFTYLLDTKVSVEISAGMNVLVDMTREKKFVEKLGFESVEAFLEGIKYPELVCELVAMDIKAVVTEAGASPKLSLWGGFVETMRCEFMREIKTPKTAYVALIESANKGGYFVDVRGVKAFMPGSLAAANKIVDFQSMIGKEVLVMIEDYISDIDSFIVSHKKYINYVLPFKLKELDCKAKYSGTITGTSKFGMFIEFGEMFTGLLHVSKMKLDTKLMFEARKFKVGDVVEFYIDEIKDNRIIMTEESTEERDAKRKDYIDSITDKEIVVSVVNNINSGILVSHEGFTGLIPKVSLKKAKLKNTKLIAGDNIRVTLQSVEGDKIYFAIP